MKIKFITIFLLGFLSSVQTVHAQKGRSDAFLSLISDISRHVSTLDQNEITLPTDDDLQTWANILSLFRMGATDSCKILLSQYNYNLILYRDRVTGNLYDIIKEQYPLQKGWGTFIYNRSHKKRLYVHVNHPVDDPQADIIGAELFRTLDAEWLLIAGTRKFRGNAITSYDVGREKNTIFQRWHELLTDLTHITLSLHAFESRSYHDPIKTTDVIISNGKTSDEQWGISQVSLAFRDSMRTEGISCGLAMYDSGYARLAGGWNSQGMFTNDSVGFGHWFYLELSDHIRNNPALYRKFIAGANRALELTGKKISQQMNRAWGLVSPRVVKVDSLHQIMFPPAAETYRIISFNANSKKDDTLDIRMGNWLEVVGSQKSLSRVTRIDSSDNLLASGFNDSRGVRPRNTLARIVNDTPKNDLHLSQHVSGDSLNSEDEWQSEPLQVHRIALRPVLSSTISNDYTEYQTPFRWEGFVNNRFMSSIPSFSISSSAVDDELAGIPNFLIPIINSSYQTGKSRFIGVQMTEMLVTEIARLVNEHKVTDKDVGLIAEQVPGGDYYLRIFPNNSKKVK